MYICKASQHFQLYFRKMSYLTLEFGAKKIKKKSIRSVKNWVTRCWHDYLSGARCKWFADDQSDATATPSSLASWKSRLVESFWCWLTQVVLEKRPLNGFLSVLVAILYMLSILLLISQLSSGMCRWRYVSVRIGWLGVDDKRLV